MDIRDKRPEETEAYLGSSGWHSNKKMCDFAVSLMKKTNPATGKKERTGPVPKEKAEGLLAKYGMKLDNDSLCGFVYAANMGKADFFKSSVPDEQHLAVYAKDVIDDPDAPDGTTMRRWYATVTAAGEPMEWDGMTWSMIRQRFVIEKYHRNVSVYYAVGSYCIDEITGNMYSTGCDGEMPRTAYDNMGSGEMDTGVAYSNFRDRKTVTVIAIASSAKGFEKSWRHGCGHLAAHICRAPGMTPYGEEIRYTGDDIVEKTREYARPLPCECNCRRHKVREMLWHPLRNRSLTCRNYRWNAIFRLNNA